MVDFKFIGYFCSMASSIGYSLSLEKKNIPQSLLVKILSFITVGIVIFLGKFDKNNFYQFFAIKDFI